MKSASYQNIIAVPRAFAGSGAAGARARTKQKFASFSSEKEPLPCST